MERLKLWIVFGVIIFYEGHTSFPLRKLNLVQVCVSVNLDVVDLIGQWPHTTHNYELQNKNIAKPNNQDVVMYI